MENLDELIKELKGKHLSKEEFESWYRSKFLSDENGYASVVPSQSGDFLDTWQGMIKYAKDKNIQQPNLFDDTLGHAVFARALKRCCQSVSNELGIPFFAVKRRILSELRNNRTARRTAIGTIKFFRDFDSDVFLVCPECDFENDPDWEICANCHYRNDSN